MPGGTRRIVKEIVTDYAAAEATVFVYDFEHSMLNFR